MPLAGAASDKVGNRYEDKWTVLCMGEVMAEMADEIRLVPPGSEGDGCEFWLKRGKITEYHQVKRQHATPWPWTISDLAGVGVLAAAFGKTKDPDSRFVFVSTLGAGELKELAEAAKAAGSYGEFLGVFKTGKFREAAWGRLLKKWRPLASDELGLDPNDTSQEAVGRVALEHLQRIEVRAAGPTDSLMGLFTKLGKRPCLLLQSCT